MGRRQQQRCAQQQEERNIGARLRQKRQETGLTLRDVSALTNIHISTLSRLESGIYTLSVHRLKIFARVFGCEERDLLLEPLPMSEMTHA